MTNEVFVSYARPDGKGVKELVTFLKSTGVRTWFDKDDLIAGQEWDKVIAKAIRESSAFLLCLSSKAVDRRGYFQKEVRVALDVAMTIPPKDLSLMLISQTQGAYVPYLWDNAVHGQLRPSIASITRIRMAADELSRAGVFESLPQTGHLKQYVLRPEFESTRLEKNTESD